MSEKKRSSSSPCPLEIVCSRLRHRVERENQAGHAIAGASSAYLACHVVDKGVPLAGVRQPREDRRDSRASRIPAAPRKSRLRWPSARNRKRGGRRMCVMMVRSFGRSGIAESGIGGRMGANATNATRAANVCACFTLRAVRVDSVRAFAAAVRVRSRFMFVPSFLWGRIAPNACDLAKTWPAGDGTRPPRPVSSSASRWRRGYHRKHSAS